MECGAGGGEEGVWSEAGAGAVGAPFVLEQALVGVDVRVLGGIRGAGGVGAVFEVEAGGCGGSFCGIDSGSWRECCFAARVRGGRRLGVRRTRGRWRGWRRTLVTRRG